MPFQGSQFSPFGEGVRTPFHSTLWGFIRTAGMENPENEIRMLDIDAGRWKDSGQSQPLNRAAGIFTVAT